MTDCGLLEAEKFTEKLSVDEPRRSNSGEDWKGGEVTASEADKPLEAPCRAQLSRLVSGKRVEYDAVSCLMPVYGNNEVSIYISDLILAHFSYS